MLAGARAAMERDQRQAAWAAWTTAALMIPAFHKPKKFPRLERILGRIGRRAQPAQTWQQQKMVAMMLNALHDGEVRARDG